MNVSTITMPAAAAQAKLDAYRSQLRRRADAEYEQAAAGYQALAAGQPLLDLVEVFAETGLDEHGRPRLAIARADRRQVEVTVRGRSDLLTFDSRLRHSGQPGRGLRIEVSCRMNRFGHYATGYSLVPMVPADVRPNADLRKLHILWEVEEWSDRPLLAVPPYDPYLLRHIAGDLYAVIAEWDLTEIERAIMKGRRDG